MDFTTVGNCDGLLKGRRYFHCPANHGVFVRSSDVICVTGRKVREFSSPVSAYKSKFVFLLSSLLVEEQLYQESGSDFLQDWKSADPQKGQARYAGSIGLFTHAILLCFTGEDS